MSLNEKIDYYGNYLDNVSKAMEKDQGAQAILNNDSK